MSRLHAGDAAIMLFDLDATLACDDNKLQCIFKYICPYYTSVRIPIISNNMFYSNIKHIQKLDSQLLNTPLTRANITIYLEF